MFSGGNQELVKCVTELMEELTLDLGALKHVSKQALDVEIGNSVVYSLNAALKVKSAGCGLIFNCIDWFAVGS